MFAIHRDSRRQAGEITITDPEHGTQHLKTYKCAHCGKHWIPQPGSGHVRGLCGRCNGFICGPGCEECIPEEAMCEILEGTRNPTAVSVGVKKLWLPGNSS